MTITVERIKPKRMEPTEVSLRLADVLSERTGRDVDPTLLDIGIKGHGAITVTAALSTVLPSSAFYATDPNDQSAIAWAELELLRRNPREIRSQRRRLTESFNGQSDINLIHNASKVLETVCAVRPDFAHGPARALGSAVKGIDPFAKGYWDMVDTFSKVSAWSGQDKLAAGVLSDVLVNQELSIAEIPKLHLNRHVVGVHEVGRVAAAYYQRSDQEQARRHLASAASWRQMADTLKARSYGLLQPNLADPGATPT